MKIVFDTNVLVNHWHLRSANWKYLFYFANNEEHTILISRLVLQELDSQWAKSVDRFESDFLALSTKSKSLFSAPCELQLKVREHYSIEELLVSRVKNLVIYEYDSVPHSLVVERAVNRKRPFTEKEKGYRDTLIWLSLLRYLELSGIVGDVAFISENRNDFFDCSVSATTFHADLLADLGALSSMLLITPYASLNEFVSKSVDKGTHSLDYNVHLPMIDEEVEYACEQYFDQMLPSALKGLLRFQELDETFYSTVSRIFSELIEGIEDPEFLRVEPMNEKDVFINYLFNIRILELTLEVPTAVYNQLNETLNRLFANIERFDNVVHLHIYFRAYFDVSFLFNEDLHGLHNFEVNEVTLI